MSIELLRSFLIEQDNAELKSLRYLVMEEDPWKRLIALYKGREQWKDSVALPLAFAATYDELGICELATKRYKEAVTQFPSLAFARQMYAAYPFRIGECDMARSELRSMLDMAPNQMMAIYASSGKPDHNLSCLLNEVGNILDDRKKYESAREYYEKAIRADPSYSHPHYNLGLLFISSIPNNYGARYHFEKAIELDPEDADAHRRLADILEEYFGEHDEAMALCETFDELDGIEDEEEDEEGDIPDDSPEAQRASLEKRISKHPDDAAARSNLAVLLEDAFEEYDEAREHYEGAIEIDPDYVNAHDNLANLLKTHFKEYDNAREHYKNAHRIPNYWGEEYEVTGHCILADLLVNHYGEYDRARMIYEKIITQWPADYEWVEDLEWAHHGLADLLANHFKEYDNAREHYERAIEIDPDNDNALAHYNLALLLTDHFKEYDEAKEHYSLADFLTDRFKDDYDARAHYERAIALRPDDAWLHYNLAVLLEEVFKDYDKAREHYQRAIYNNMDSVLAYNNLATLLEEKFHEYDRARDYYERAIENYPHDAYAYIQLADLLGEIYDDNEAMEYLLERATEIYDYDEVRKYFDKAIKLDPENPDTYRMLAHILDVHFEERDEATALLEIANELEKIEEDPYDAWAHYNLANLLTDHFGEHGKAREHFEKAIEIDPDDADARNNLAILLKTHFNEHDKAMALCEKFDELDEIEGEGKDVNRTSGVPPTSANTASKTNPVDMNKSYDCGAVEGDTKLDAKTCCMDNCLSGDMGDPAENEFLKNTEIEEEDFKSKEEGVPDAVTIKGKKTATEGPASTTKKVPIESMSKDLEKVQKALDDMLKSLNTKKVDTDPKTGFKGAKNSTMLNATSTEEEEVAKCGCTEKKADEMPEGELDDGTEDEIEKEPELTDDKIEAIASDPEEVKKAENSTIPNALSAKKEENRNDEEDEVVFDFSPEAVRISYEKQRTSLENRIKEHPDDTDAHYDLALLLTYHFNEYDKAREQYERAIALRSDEAYAHINFANLLKTRFRDYDEVRSLREKTDKIDEIDEEYGGEEDEAEGIPDDSPETDRTSLKKRIEENPDDAHAQNHNGGVKVIDKLRSLFRAFKSR